MDKAARAAAAAGLRAEARDVLIDTGLLALLQERFGEAHVTGSAGYDLMVSRDIDVEMPVDPDSALQWAGFAADIARQLDAVGLALHRASFLNDYLDPHPLGAGFYWGIGFTDFAGHPWRCELWGWEPLDFAVRQARDANLRADLARCDRDLVLRLKAEARAHGGMPLISSFDIYRFAIAKAGETLDELEAWKAAS